MQVNACFQSLWARSLAPCSADTVLSISRHGMEPSPDGCGTAATWALVQAAGLHAAPRGILSSEAAREVAPETLQVSLLAYLSSVALG